MMWYQHFRAKHKQSMFCVFFLLFVCLHKTINYRMIYFHFSSHPSFAKTWCDMQNSLSYFCCSKISSKPYSNNNMTQFEQTSNSKYVLREIWMSDQWLAVLKVESRIQQIYTLMVNIKKKKIIKTVKRATASVMVNMYLFFCRVMLYTI